jgi:hypothetical protein
VQQRAVTASNLQHTLWRGPVPPRGAQRRANCHVPRGIELLGSGTVAVELVGFAIKSRRILALGGSNRESAPRTVELTQGLGDHDAVGANGAAFVNVIERLPFDGPTQGAWGNMHQNMGRGSADALSAVKS